MILLIEIAFTLFRISILSYTSFKITKKYFESKFNPILFLNLASISYLILDIEYLGSLIIMSYYTETYPNLVHAFFFINIAFTLTLVLPAFLAIYLFFYSLENESIKTLKILNLIFLNVFINTSIFISGMIAGVEAFDGKIDPMEYLFYGSISYNIFLYFSLINGLFSLVIIVMIYFKIDERLQDAKNPKIESNLKLMRLSFAVILIGSTYSFLTIDGIAYTIAIIGFLGFFISYLRGDLLLESKRLLRNFFVINNTGTPIYSYQFPSMFKNNIPGPLFTGALIAISQLLAEFTGLQQQLKEINLSDTKILIKPINNHYLALLILDNATDSIKNAYNSFVLSIFHDIPNKFTYKSLNLPTSLELENKINYYFNN